MSAGSVLVIEDDPKIAGVLQRGLGLQDIAVTVAADGAAGRTAWATGAFDLVLLDVMLPGIDGISLCVERRAARTRFGIADWPPAPPITSASHSPMPT